MSGILDGLSSTFTTCACGASTRDCALKAMETFVESPVPPSPHLFAENEGKVDLGPLVGSKRGFKTRERVLGSGGLSGVEMDYDGMEQEEEWDIGEGLSSLSARSNVRDVAAAFRATHQSISASTSSPKRKVPQALPKLILSPATTIASSSPRNDRSGKAPRHRMDWKGKGKAMETFPEDAMDEGRDGSSQDSNDDRFSVCIYFSLVLITDSILDPERCQRRKKRIRRSVSIDPSPSSPLQPRSISFSHFRRSSSPRSPQSEDIELALDGEDMVFVEHKMPPKMRKKWIHNAADTLKESLQKGERLGGDEVVIAEGGMEIDLEGNNDMTGEKEEAIGAMREHEAEDIEMNMKAGEDIDIEMEPSGAKTCSGTLPHTEY